MSEELLAGGGEWGAPGEAPLRRLAILLGATICPPLGTLITRSLRLGEDCLGCGLRSQCRVVRDPLDQNRGPGIREGGDWPPEHLESSSPQGGGESAELSPCDRAIHVWLMLGDCLKKAGGERLWNTDDNVIGRLLRWGETPLPVLRKDGLHFFDV
ncbi:hypothetical protein ACLOJK_015111 [Asimina triloba]